MRRASHTDGLDPRDPISRPKDHRQGRCFLLGDGSVLSLAIFAPSPLDGTAPPSLTPCWSSISNSSGPVLSPSYESYRSDAMDYVVMGTTGRGTLGDRWKTLPLRPAPRASHG